MENKGLQTAQLKIGYGSDLIKDICVKVTPGQIVTLIGPNGCGKTTLLKTLTGELKARGGVVLLNGKDRAELSASEIAKRMSIVMTHKVKPELMTCYEVVAIGRYPYTGRLGILSAEDHRKVREAMQWTDVEGIADDFYAKISDGQRQRVLLARAICQEPEILILDEPTSYLDIRYQIELLEKIVALAKEKNVAVLMSLHELPIARRVSDLVVALSDGAVQMIGKPEEVFSEPFIRELYGIGQMDVALLGSAPWFVGAQAPTKDADAHASAKLADASATAKVAAAAVTGSSAPVPSTTAKVIMVQGTMSNVGKSVIAAGLCRIFADDGYRVAPFKSQNMALNSYVTEEGLEMGRAQVMQAECARVKPVSDMNPILLKPTGDTSSQVIVGGKVVANMKAAEYFRRKTEFIDDILKAYARLSKTADIIVVEGAGSPVEMNLKENDIVNMGLAKMLDAPVLLIGDIDRGGVFAQLLGTLDLFEEEERSRVAGLIVNKFRGDPALFEEGVRILSDKGKTKVVGMVPYLPLALDDEDSLSERLLVSGAAGSGIDVAVIRLAHIANFTDFMPFVQVSGVSVRYVTEAAELGDPDLVILPGSKNTIADLNVIKENGLAGAVKTLAKRGTCVIGICGGYQMLGRTIDDPEHTESGGSAVGLNLLPVDTVLATEKTRKNVTFAITGATGILSSLAGKTATGYEIHMGQTRPFAGGSEDAEDVRESERTESAAGNESETCTEFTQDRTGYCCGNVYGTYLHGFFDKKEVLTALLTQVAASRGKTVDTANITDYADFKEQQYDLLAKALRESLDIDYIYKIMGLKS